MTSSHQVARPPHTRFRDLIAAEWTKLWSLRSLRWVLVLSTLAPIAINVNHAVDIYLEWPAWSPMDQVTYDPRLASFTHTAYQLLALAAGAVGALVVAGEYGSGLIRTTFAAVPARASVAMAKLVVVTAAFLLVGTIVAITSFFAAQEILAARGSGMSIGDDGAMRAIAASVLYPPVAALIGMGLAALVKHTAGSIAAVGVVLLIIPSLLGNSDQSWAEQAYNAVPDAAHGRLVNSEAMYVNWDIVPTIAGSWLAYAVWPLIAAVVTVAFVVRREP